MIFPAFIFGLALVQWPCVHSTYILCPVQTGSCPANREGYSLGNDQYFCCPEDSTIVLGNTCRCHLRPTMALSECLEGAANCSEATTRVENDDGVHCCPEGYSLHFSSDRQQIRTCQCFYQRQDNIRRDRYPYDRRPYDPRPYYRRPYYQSRGIPRRVSDGIQRSVANALQIANDVVDAFSPPY